jgi:hypothetical protein
LPDLEGVSLSRVPVLVEAEGISLRGEFVRHWAPATVSKLLALLPISGRISWYGEAFLYFPVSMAEGPEKARTSFTEGEIAFLPGQAVLCIFTSALESPRPATPVGRLLEPAKPLKGLRAGRAIRIRRGMT